jgi:predicted alpha/beta superfamily hydrolase
MDGFLERLAQRARRRLVYPVAARWAARRYNRGTMTIKSLCFSTLFAGLLLGAAAHATTVRVHYPAGKETILIRADKGPSNWDTGVPATADGPLNVWTYTWPDALGDIAMKPTLGPDQVSIGGAYRIPAGATLDIYPFFGPPFGKLTLIKDFASPQLGNKRTLRVWLPASYQENPAKRYPVLYMQDGQNLFDPRTATYGTDWGLGKTINQLVASGAMTEVIVVGIDATPGRVAEYTPCCDPQYGGGQLDQYDAFVAATVKPYIDRTYRTLPGRDTTAILGSSLGGLAALSIAQKHPDMFGKAGAMSGAFWWNGGAPAKKAAHSQVAIYLDAGTRDDDFADTLKMHDALLAKGYKDGGDLMFYKAEGGRRDERSWAARVERPLTWFFGW